MCGIIGSFGPNIDLISEDMLRASAGLMKYRGPDSTGYYYSEIAGVKCAHNRLGIVGLDQKYDQPFLKDGSMLAFNGEIYGYKERGYESDTELLIDLLNKNPESALRSCIGMYAGCYAGKDGAVKLFRDYYGKKPLYISEAEGLVMFSSEVKPLMRLRACLGFSNTLCSDAVSSYLLGGAVHANGTLVKEIREFPANSVFTWCRGASKGSAGEIYPYGAGLVDDANESFEELFLASVFDRSIADVPMALTFSGGIDSLAVAVGLTEVGSSASLYTLRSGSNDEEVRQSEKAASALDAHHIIRDFDNPDVATLIGMLQTLDHPTMDSSFINTHEILRQVSGEFRVCLSGDGGDELLGGYQHYKWFDSTVNLSFLRSWIPELSSLMQRFGKQRLTSKTLASIRSEAAALQFFSRLDGVPALSKSSLGLGDVQAVRSDRVAEYQSFLDASSQNTSRDVTERASFADLHSSMRYLILHKVDRASMLNSVEVRSPLLDIRLLEWRRQMVKDGKWPLINRKQPLKKVISDRLGPDFLKLPKTGFGVDLKKINSGLYGSGHLGVVEEALSDIGIDCSGVISDVKSGASGIKAKAAYAIFALGMWIHQTRCDLKISGSKP